MKEDFVTEVPLSLFFSSHNARLSVPRVNVRLSLEALADIGDNKKCNHDLRDIAEKAGIKRHLHWHLSRHTCATLLNQHGLNMQEIQFILGHSKLATTEKHYAETLYQQVRQALTKAF